MRRGGSVARRQNSVPAELSELRSGFAKVQLIARPLPEQERLQALVDILSYKASGSVAEIIARGSAGEVQQKLLTLKPLLCESVR